MPLFHLKYIQQRYQVRLVILYHRNRTDPIARYSICVRADNQTLTLILGVFSPNSMSKYQTASPLQWRVRATCFSLKMESLFRSTSQSARLALSIITSTASYRFQLTGCTTLACVLLSSVYCMIPLLRGDSLAVRSHRQDQENCQRCQDHSAKDAGLYKRFNSVIVFDVVGRPLKRRSQG
jgi:hypothetical protein